MSEDEGKPPKAIRQARKILAEKGSDLTNLDVADMAKLERGGRGQQVQ